MAKSLYPIVLFNVFISSSGRSLWKILETCLKDEYSWHNLYEKLEKLNYYRQKPSFNEIKASQSSWFQGSNYIQFKTHVVPTLKKNPTFTITLAGANDATHETSRQILDSLLELQHEIMKTLPDCNVIFSKPKLHVEFVDNSNICVEHIHKQPPRGVLNKRCSQNMQQIYRRTPMPKCVLNKVVYSNHTSAWVFSCRFSAYFQNTFFSEHLWVAASAHRPKRISSQ